LVELKIELVEFLAVWQFRIFIWPARIIFSLFCAGFCLFFD